MNNPRELLHKDGSPMREYTSKIIEELMNEDKKQTAVEWLESKVLYIVPSSQKDDLLKLFQQAIAMEKEQIEKAWWAGHDERDGNKMIHPSEDCNQYYNETYAK
jgi:hypoxanthine phosphoribosyltransferase